MLAKEEIGRKVVPTFRIAFFSFPFLIERWFAK
jgi:hypothetical protein